MGLFRPLLYLVGALLVVGGLVMLFFETGMASWVPAGIALAGLIILVGLLIVGMSNRVTEPRHVEYHEDEPKEESNEERSFHTAPPERIVKERNVERDTRPGSRRVHKTTRTMRTSSRPSRDERHE